MCLDIAAADHTSECLKIIMIKSLVIAIIYNLLSIIVAFYPCIYFELNITLVQQEKYHLTPRLKLG